ncbi:hypothetical protein AB0H36_01210 [Kribbella sp. NPDC050820]|uniref:PIN-like domain-containing protein n=1 Tax=Kribbella sp. NPDC050820 TaxID=3155408 RepID=UPI0034098641
MSGPTSEQPRFYIDVGLGGIAIPHLVRRLGSEALTKHEVFGRRTVEDTEWIAWADAEDLVVLTKDDAIRRRPLERAALARSGLRVFCLTNANLTKAEQVLRFECLWPALSGGASSPVRSSVACTPTGCRTCVSSSRPPWTVVTPLWWGRTANGLWMVTSSCPSPRFESESDGHRRCDNRRAGGTARLRTTSTGWSIACDGGARRPGGSRNARR